MSSPKTLGRLRPSYTVNYGLRYEYALVPTPSITNPYYPQTGIIHSPTHNVAPRIGLAYHLNDKTVFRAGYGLFFDRFESGLINTLVTANGVYTQSLTITSPTAVGAPIFPNTLDQCGFGDRRHIYYLWRAELA